MNGFEITNNGFWIALALMLAFALVFIANAVIEHVEETQNKRIGKGLLNQYVDKACYFDGDVINCPKNGFNYVALVLGFPVDIDFNSPSGVIIHSEVFNDVPQIPDGWNNFDYETTILTPWLISMGFREIAWMYREFTFDDVPSSAKMVLQGYSFVFNYSLGSRV